MYHTTPSVFDAWPYVGDVAGDLRFCLGIQCVDPEEMSDAEVRYLLNVLQLTPEMYTEVRAMGVKQGTPRHTFTMEDVHGALLGLPVSSPTTRPTAYC